MTQISSHHSSTNRGSATPLRMPAGFGVGRDRLATKSVIRCCLLIVGLMPSIYAFGPYKTTAERWPETKDFTIEWKQDWDTTIRDNEQSWRSEMRKNKLKGQLGERWFKLRMIKMLEQLPSKFPTVEKRKRDDAKARMAEYLHQQGFVASANLILKEIVDEAEPGDWETVAQRLRRILELTPAENAYHVEDAEAWVEYASTRVLALHRAGLIPEYDPAVQRAMQSRVASLRVQGRLREATEQLNELAELTGRDRSIDHEESRIRRLTQPSEEMDEVKRPDVGLSVEIRQILDDAKAGGVHNAEKLLDVFANDKVSHQLVSRHESEGIYTSVWNKSRAILNGNYKNTKQLGDKQEEEARFEYETLEPPVSAQKLFSIYRRFPLSPAGAEALLAFSERMLSNGHYDIAHRSFIELAHHPHLDPLHPKTRDRDQLRRKTRSGVWMSLANLPWGEAQLKWSLSGADKKLRYPWLGKELSVDEIQRQLDARPEKPGAIASALTSGILKPRFSTLERPDTYAWNHPLFEVYGSALIDRLPPVEGETHSYESGSLICGPWLLAWYENGERKPAWVKTGRSMTPQRGKRYDHYLSHLFVPNSFKPSIDQGRLFTRWGTDPENGVPTSVIALQVKDGTPIWSTSRDEEWRRWNWQPINDPVASEGKVYVMVVEGGKDESPVHLLCHSAKDGGLVWQRKLGQQRMYQEGVATLSGFGGRGQRFDLVRFGSSVTVTGAAIYCQTNMGIIAKVDARDGMVEWLTHYERPKKFDYSAERFIFRRGTAPIFRGDAIVFAPRDTQSVLSLSSETGALYCGLKFEEANFATPVESGLILQGDTSLSRVATHGAVRWRRELGERLAILPGQRNGTTPGQLFVGTETALLLIDAKTGRELSRQAWPAGHSYRTASVRWESSEGGHAQPIIVSMVDPPIRKAPGHDVPSTPLELPLRLGWKLERPNPRMWTPPVESGLHDRLFVYSNGQIDCLRRAASGETLWSREVPRNFELVWQSGALLLVTEKSVLLMDGNTGKTRWQSKLPFPAAVHGVAQGMFVFFDAKTRPRYMAAIDLKTGREIWRKGAEHYRYLHDLIEPSTSNNHGYSFGIYEILDSNGSITIAGDIQNRTGWFADLDPKTGEIRSTHTLPGKNQAWTPYVAFDNGVGVVATRRSWPLHRFRLDGGPTPPLFDDDKGEQWQIKEFRSTGSWIQLLKERKPDAVEYAVLNIQDPSYKLVTSGMGTIHEDRMYEISGFDVSVTDLKTRKLAGRYQIRQGDSQDNIVASVKTLGNRSLIAITTTSRNGGPLQVDMFNVTTGERLGSQMLSHTYHELFHYTSPYTFHGDWRHEQISAGDDVVFVADEEGINAWIPGTVDETASRQVAPIVYLDQNDIEVDGFLDDWQNIKPQLLSHGRSKPAELRLTHDDKWMHLSLKVPDSNPRPHLGRGPGNGGDWLELAYGQYNNNNFHWGFGLDAQGRQVIDEFGRRTLPEGSLVEVRYDYISDAYNYEIRLPAFPDDGRTRERRQLGLSFIVWDDDGSGNANGRFSFGSGLTGSGVDPTKHARAYLHSLSVKGEAAADELARQFPDSQLMWDYQSKMFDIRKNSLGLDMEKQLHDYIRAHPNGVWTARVLGRLARRHDELNENVRAQILKTAAELGVSEELRSNFELRMKARLNQQIFVRAKPGKFHGMTVIINAHIHEKNWKYATLGNVNPKDGRNFGLKPDVDKWQTFSIPLMLLGIDDQPFYGLGISFSGNADAFWDQTVLDNGRRKLTVIDDDLPDARIEGEWEATGVPVNSGKKSFTSKKRSLKLHRLMHPFIEHVVEPTGVPYLSQWVYTHPDDPPKAVSISLHNGGEWEWRGLWGDMYQHPRPTERRTTDHYLGPRLHWGYWWIKSNDAPSQKGRYMGSLPKAGEWHELRIPITWTPFTGRIINGIRFENLGGKCYWDRTSVVVNGKESVVFEDETPAGRVSRDWEWVEAPVKSGKRAHFGNQSMTLNSYERYGANVVSDLEVPIYQHITHDPVKLADSLIARLPLLQESELAKDLFDQSLPFIEGALRDKPEVRLSISSRLLEAKAWPTDSRCARVLGFHTAALKDTGVENANNQVEKLILELDLSLEARHEYRRNYAGLDQHFVRHWQILGMYPNNECHAYDTVFDPEKDGFRGDAAYEVGDNTLKWQLYESQTDFVDLLKAFKTDNDFMLGYATCWVYFPKAMRIRLELGADDGFKTWLNGKPFVRWHRHWSAVPRDIKWDYNVPSGWSEFMIKLGNAGLDWGFYVQFVDAEGFGPPEGFQVRATPPKDWQGREKRTAPIQK